MDSFIKERNDALFSLNEKKLVDYFNKYKIDIPKNKIIFWAAIHKARLGITTLPKNEYIKSVQWLEKHGFSKNIF